MTEEIVSNFLGHIPFGYAIGSPLKAVVEAQGQAALQSLDFIEKVGFERDGNNTNPRKVQNVTFTVQKGDQNVRLEAPLLSMVNVPYIRVQQAAINFDIKIHSTIIDNTDSGNSKAVEAGGGGNIFTWKASVDTQVSYTSTKDHHSTLEKTGEVHINVIAVQDDMPEGLRSLIGILNDSLTHPDANTPDVIDTEQEG